MSHGHTVLQPHVATAWPSAAPAPSDRRVEPFVASRALLGALLALLVCRMVAANAIVPPWQGPDEPTHFALARQLTRADGRQAAVIQEFEREILQSMARHGWWRYYQEPTPEPIPHAFSQVPEHLSHGTLDQPAYYLLAASLLRLVPAADIEGQYFALRTLSILLTAITIAFGWLGTRALFGSLTAVGALAIVVLHPQFLLSAMSVNPDALINVCGAFIWWQVAVIRDAGRWGRVASIAAMLAAALVAALSKRNGLPLGVLAIAGSALALGMPARRAAAIAVSCAAVLAGATAALVYGDGTYSEPARRLLTYWGAVFTTGRFDMSPARLSQFASAAVDTSWLVAGWLRFPPPDAWAWIARAATVAGFAGALAAWRAGHASRPLALAGLFVAVHAGGLLLVTFIAGSAPQGRYLFAVLFPAAAVFWSGLMFWARPAYQQWAIVGIVALMATLDLTGFLFVLLPAYAQ